MQLKSSYETPTTEGAIPHAQHPAGFLMPVKLRSANLGVGNVLVRDGELATPVRRDGRLVYALPGGGEWVSE